MLSRNQIEEMVTMRVDEQMPLAQIGTRFGITAERVRQVLKAQGISTARKVQPKRRPKASKESQYDWDEIERLYVVNELSSYDIADVVGGNATYIRQGLANIGVIRPQKEAALLKQRQRTDEQLVGA